MKIKIDSISVEEIKTVIKDHTESPDNVRVYLAGMGCSGPSFGLALDDLKEGDIQEDVSGVNFIMEQDLIHKFEGFTVEKIGEGFRVVPFAGVESGCSSCGGSCG